MEMAATTQGSAADTRLSLIGGPLHGLGRRLGLVRDETGSLGLGLALGGVLWGVLVLLAASESLGHRLFSLTALGVHVRLLVAVPLMFACEAMFDPRAGVFVDAIVRARIVVAKDLPALRALVVHTLQCKSSSWPDALCLLAAALTTTLGAGQHLYGESVRAASVFTSPGSFAALWYWGVCLTAFRFLLLRWLWRLALWYLFLWRLSRLDLELMAAHPDAAGGIGFLEVVHGQLGMLVLAISTIEAASFAEGIAAGSMGFDAIYPALALLVCVNAGLVLGPLFFFAPKLRRVRIDGLDRYDELASRYVEAYEAKWMQGRSDEQLLGNSDTQSMADLGSVVDRVRGMRWVPFGRRLISIVLAGVLMPAAPLMLFKIPLMDLIQKLSAQVLGL